MGAADATLADALDCFEGDWHWLADELLDGRCALWLGSAISASRFPNLGGLFEIAFRLLHDLGDHEAVAKLVALSAATAEIDPSVAFGAWSDEARDQVIDGLWNQYSTVLGTATADGTRIKELLDLPAIYADPDAEPDADHRFLALLIEEGAVVEMVSGNWDELIERAHSDCQPERSVRVIVRPEEMVEGVDHPSIFKFHGCARKALDEPAIYGPLIVATKDEVDAFRDGDDGRPLREALRTSIRRRPVLLVGLSGQDGDIQAMFDRAADGLQVAFRDADQVDGRPAPRLTVASNVLGDDQRQLLRHLYGQAFDDDPDGLAERAAVPLFSKPFFGGLYVHNVLAKTRLSLDHPFPGPHRETVAALAAAACARARQGLCRAFVDSTEPEDDRWRRLADELPAVITRLVGLYRDQRLASGPRSYASPWAGLPHRKLHEAPFLVWGLAYDRLLASLDLLRRIGTRPGWTLRWLDADMPACHATVETAERLRRVVVLLPATGRDLLEQRGALDDIDDPDLVFLYAVGPRPATQTRAPRRHLPRGRGSAAADEPAELWLDELLASDLDRVVDDLAWELVA